MDIINARVEGFYEQLGVDEQQPQFSWGLAGTGRNEYQTRYRLTVAITKADLISEKHLQYDSGIVEGDATIGIEYAGEPLDAVTKYFWKVQVWEQSGAVLESDILSFVTGKLGDQWRGQWIGNGTAKPFYARKTHSVVGAIREAYALVCGLGQFVFYMNGQKVGDHEIDPGWTNYDRLVQYVTFDVKDLLAAGTNVFGLDVANGWYISDAGGRYFVKAPQMKFISRFSNSSELDGYQPFSNMLAAIAEVHVVYEDGTREVIGTDASWKTHESATRLANVLGSEIYDARRNPAGWLESDFDDADWKEAAVIDAADKPKGTLTAQSQPPVYIKKVYEPVSVRHVDEGLLFDLGQNMSGMLEITVKGKAGQSIDLSPAEKLDENGTIDQTIEDASIMEWGDLNVKSTYILRGDPAGETWKQQFSYFGGRYILVRGATDDENVTELPYLQSLKARYVTSKSEVAGTFTCSDARIDDVYKLVIEAVDSNMQHVHTDCPHIERLAWLEISHLLAPSIMFYKDVNALWRKIFQDIRVDQYAKHDFDQGSDGKPHYRGEGFIPARAPNYVMMSFDTPLGNVWDVPTWGSTIIIGVDWHYRYYGNKRIIAENYDTAKRYVRYLNTKLTDEGFLNHGLGDWGNPELGSLAKANIETAIYYYDLKLLAKFATVLERESEAASFNEQAAAVLDNYNRRLLVKNDKTGLWGYQAARDPKPFIRLATFFPQLVRRMTGAGTLNMTPACQALPLFFEMVPDDKLEDVRETLSLALGERGFMCGEVALPYVLQSLRAIGEDQRIFDFVISEEHPSYYRFVMQGETTLPEFWKDNARSRNHDMLGHIVEWFYNGMAGINSKSAAFKEISIRPFLPGSVNVLNCGYESVRGRIEVHVERSGAEIELNVTVPPNTSAALDLSGLGGDSQTATIAQLEKAIEGPTINLNSGKYTITLN